MVVSAFSKVAIEDSRVARWGRKGLEATGPKLGPGTYSPVTRIDGSLNSLASMAMLSQSSEMKTLSPGLSTQHSIPCLSPEQGWHEGFGLRPGLARPGVARARDDLIDRLARQTTQTVSAMLRRHTQGRPEADRVAFRSIAWEVGVKATQTEMDAVFDSLQVVHGGSLDLPHLCRQARQAAEAQGTGWASPAGSRTISLGASHRSRSAFSSPNILHANYGHSGPSLPMSSSLSSLRSSTSALLPAGATVPSIGPSRSPFGRGPNSTSSTAGGNWSIPVNAMSIGLALSTESCVRDLRTPPVAHLSRERVRAMAEGGVYLDVNSLRA